MILESQNTCVAFRCPCCGKAVLSSVNLFRLRGDMFRLRCPDCDTALTVKRTNDGKFRLTVPCLMCEHPHQFTISENAFFDKELFSVPCSLSGIDIFFAGSKEAVQNAMVENGKELEKILKDAGIEDFSALHRRNEEEIDPAVDSVVHLLLTELEEEGKITCYCKEEGEIPLYDFQVLSERVRVFCHCCGAEAYLPLRSEADAEDFIKTDRLDLK